jgi:hypothetical protein
VGAAIVLDAAASRRIRSVADRLEPSIEISGVPE